jgi:hypothetical protein
MYRYITLDGNKYAISQGTYTRRWTRAFSSQLAASIIRLNFVDRGPGIRVYSMQLMLFTWPTDSEVYSEDGIVKTMDQQISDLEASYAKIATPLTFLDAFGNPPSASSKVYFTNMVQSIPNYSTVQKGYALYDIELTEATQIVA